jgi:hypothetical protein
LIPSVSGAIGGESCEDFALRVAYGDRRVFRLLSRNECGDVRGAEAEAFPADFFVGQDAASGPRVHSPKVDVQHFRYVFASQ